MKDRLWTTGFAATTAIHTAVSLGFVMLLPTLPMLALTDLGAKSHQLGWIVGVFTLFVLLSRPLGSKLLKRWGSTRILHAGLPLLVAATFFYFLVQNMAQLLVLRALHGFIFGILSTATATRVVEIIPKSIRGRGIGYFGMFQASSLAIGPPVGLYLLNRSSWELFAMMSLITLVAAIIALLFVREKQASAREEETTRSSRWMERKAVPASVTMLFMTIVFGAVLGYLPLLAETNGLDDWTGMYFLCYSAGLVLVRPVSGKIVDKGWMSPAVWSGLFLSAVALAATAQSTAASLFMISAFLLGVGFAFVQTALQVLALEGLPPSRYAAATGTFYLSLDIGYGVGSAGFGYLLLFVDLQSLYLSLVTLPVLAFVSYGWSAKRMQRE